MNIVSRLIECGKLNNIHTLEKLSEGAYFNINEVLLDEVHYCHNRNNKF